MKVPSYKASSFITTKILRLKHEARGQDRHTCNQGLSWHEDPNAVRDTSIFPISGGHKTLRAQSAWRDPTTDDRSRSMHRGRSTRAKSPAYTEDTLRPNSTPKDFLGVIARIRDEPDYAQILTDGDLQRLKTWVYQAHENGTLRDSDELDHQKQVDSFDEFLQKTRVLNVMHIATLNHRNRVLYELFTETVHGRVAERNSINNMLGSELRTVTQIAADVGVSAAEVERYMEVYRWKPCAIKFNLCTFHRENSCRRGDRCAHIHIDL